MGVIFNVRFNVRHMFAAMLLIYGHTLYTYKLYIFLDGPFVRYQSREHESH